MIELLDWFEAGEHTWILRVFITVFVTALIHLITRLILKKVADKLQMTRTLWDDALIQALQLPLLLLVWVLGISVAAELVQAVADSDLFSYTPLVRRIAIILLLMTFLLRFIKNAEQNFLHRKKEDAVGTDVITIRVIARLLRLSVLITAVLVILQTLGISVTGVVAFGGIGGIAIGFAAKDLLANFFGGLMIYLDRPFTVGDWIRSPDRDIEGTVEDIGWRLTRIRTFDKRPLYVPNATFTTIAVENPSRMHNRRINETFGLRYCDAALIKEIIVDVKAMLQEHPEIDTAATLIVNFNALSASSLDFFIYTFTKTTDWVHFHEVKQDVLLKVIDIIHGHGADIAFPTRTLDGLEALTQGPDSES